MPLFLSDEEFERCSHDASLVAKKADTFIRQLLNQLETVKAEADAASITAEQTCSLLEQRHINLTEDFSNLQSQLDQLNDSLKQRDSQVAELEAHKHQIHIQIVEKDGDIHLLSTEVSELHKSKRQLMELLEQKDLEISEKNATIKSYLDKIVNLTENAASKECRICDLECELARSEASRARLSQEKELVERHNSWLNDEIKVKVDSLVELRKLHSELGSEMSSKLADAEKRCNETCSSLAWKDGRMRELESKLSSLEQELFSSKDTAADAEKHFLAEISTLTKLMELYKESSEAWSKKAGELDGAFKALETRLHQVENDSKERLEKEISTKNEVEKEAQAMKEKILKYERELQKFSLRDEQRLVLSSFTTERFDEPVEAMVDDHFMLMPSVPAGVSGTALAASLLRDGWSLAKIYSKYQEAVDALRHECLGRKQSQEILDRVLYEIEEKAAVIMEERAEHERLVESYSVFCQKLQDSLAEQTTLQRQIEEQKVDIRRHERNYAIAEKEFVDLQKQVALLLKECRDLQLRSGFGSADTGDALIVGSSALLDVADDSQRNYPEYLLPFKDITGLVEQNVQLRHLVHNLSEENEIRETQLKEKHEKELEKQKEDAACKVGQILSRAEEQGHMIESLHTSVAMYKKLHEEHNRLFSQSHEGAIEGGRSDIMMLQESSPGYSKKAQEKALERLRLVEEELGNARNEIITMRSERDKLAIEVQLAKEKLTRYVEEFEHQRNEYNNTLARNVEFSHLIIDYQRKLRESSEELNVAEEESRKLTVEISLLKQEKEISLNSEKRASDEIRDLTARAHRLQASLDTIQSTEEIREEARCAERKRKEQYMKQIEIECAAAKKELLEERENVRNFALERESGMISALKQVEGMQKELSDVLHALSAAEARAAVAEARCTELLKLKSSYIEASVGDVNDAPSSSNKVISDLHAAKQELDKMREEAQVNKEHMLQYKSIAQANDDLLKQLEFAHENLKSEVENVKKLLEAELLSLGAQFHELEVKCNLKTEEIASVIENKEEAVASLSLKIASVREEYSIKMSQFAVMEATLSSLKDDWEKERKKSCTAQANYERQVIMQSNTIQELTKTSQTLSTLQEEASHLRILTNSLKIENNELKVRLETENSVLEVLKNDADRKYSEVNELNKILHSRLEALHIKLAEMDRHNSSGVSGSSSLGLSDDDDGLQNVVKYLRRSKEIADTEISLLKLEKLRLQSQLESALQSAEAAQVALNAERANSKAFLFGDEEFKGLQLQVREISLLRESNMQLREENKHNFEECQKLREALRTATIESHNLHKSLEDRQNDVEACRKEIEKQKMEKEALEKRIDELLEKCKSFDQEDYARIRATLEQMEVKLKEKEAQLEEVNKVSSERLIVISHLEQDLSRSKMELSERESRINGILQTEASLKNDNERQKRSVAQLKKRSENLSKDKEDLHKENQVLLKQLEDARQGKRIVGDAAGEQKEKEKDTRIQTLEKAVERLKEELKKEKEELKKEKEENKTEKEKRLKTQKTISDSFDNVSQERSKLLDKLDKHKHGLKMLAGEVEKLKPGKDSELEGTSEMPVLSGTFFEDLASAYLQAVDSFERVAQPVATELSSSTTDLASMDVSSLNTIISQGTATMAPSTLPSASLPANVSPVRVEEKARKIVLAKSTFEARRTGRKLVRPRITNTEDTQGDIDMSEQDGPESSTRPSPSRDTDTPVNVTLPVSQPIRKRPSVSFVTETQDLNVSGEQSAAAAADVSGPMLKKYKNSETSLDIEEVQPSEIVPGAQSPVNLEEYEVLAFIEEQIAEDITDNFRGTEDGTETSKKQEVELASEMHKEEEVQDDKGATSKIVTEEVFPETGGEHEEGELILDTVVDVEGGGGGSLSNIIEIPETGEENIGGSDTPSGVDEEQQQLDVDGMEPGEIEDSFQALDDDKNIKGEGIITDEIGESSVKTDSTYETPEETLVRIEKSSTINASATGESSIIRQVEPSSGNNGGGDNEDGNKQTSPSNRILRTINLEQRAKERGSLRQAGMFSSLTGRARGRTTLHGRGRGRGSGSGSGSGRGGGGGGARGQDPSKQG